MNKKIKGFLIANIIYILCIWFIVGNHYPSETGRFIIIAFGIPLNIFVADDTLDDN